jgi:hypothetical protein
MAKTVKSDLKTEHATYASDFIPSDVENVSFLGDPILDNMMTTMVAVCSEVWSNRRRTRVIERLLAEKGITEDMIENYMPSEEEEAAWQAERDQFIAMAFEPLIRRSSMPVDADWPDRD